MEAPQKQLESSFALRSEKVGGTAAQAVAVCLTAVGEEATNEKLLPVSWQTLWPA